MARYGFDYRIRDNQGPTPDNLPEYTNSRDEATAIATARALTTGRTQVVELWASRAWHLIEMASPKTTTETP